MNAVSEVHLVEALELLTLGGVHHLVRHVPHIFVRELRRILDGSELPFNAQYGVSARADMYVRSA